MTYHIRPARVEDNEELRAVFRTSWDFLLTSTLGLRDRSGVIDPENLHATIVAEAPDGKLLGFASLKDSVLNRLYVDPSFHGRGLGRVLLQESERLGARVLWVDEGNVPARRLYESRGWAWDGTTDPGRYWPELCVLRYRLEGAEKN